MCLHDDTIIHIQHALIYPGHVIFYVDSPLYVHVRMSRHEHAHSGCIRIHAVHIYPMHTFWFLCMYNSDNSDIVSERERTQACVFLGDRREKTGKAAGPDGGYALLKVQTALLTTDNPYQCLYVCVCVCVCVCVYVCMHVCMYVCIRVRLIKDIWARLVFSTDLRDTRKFW